MMRIDIGILFVVGLLMGSIGSLKAQDVVLSVPASNIFNRTEFNTVANVMNTNGHTKWRRFFIGLLYESPNIRSISGNTFTHTSLPGISLPNTVLEWQLHTIGGSDDIRGGNKPGFLHFSSSSQRWYDLHPDLLNFLAPADYESGFVAFKFKIPAYHFANQSFRAGEYSMAIGHNYSDPSLYGVQFTPTTFNTIISIPGAVSWRSSLPSRTYEISSLDDYRTHTAYVLGDLLSEVAHTLDFNLRAKASSPNIQFISSTNVQGSLPVSLIQVSSSHSDMINSSLTSNWQNFSATPRIVQAGNRNNFTQRLSISATGFKTYFFEAGTYTFQLNREARSTDNSISDVQNTEVIIVVPALSEINIGSGGQTVNFDFNTPAQYEQGQSKVIPRHLRLSNNQNFELYVRSSSNYFTRSGIQSNVPANTLEVGVSQAPATVPLSTTPQKIISNGNPVLDQDVDIRYSIPADKARNLLDKDKTTYTLDVIYSFTAL